MHYKTDILNKIYIILKIKKILNIINNKKRNLNNYLKKLKCITISLSMIFYFFPY
jgi:hypothetical protein